MFIGTLVKLKKSMKQMDIAYEEQNWKECYSAALEADKLLEKYGKEVGGFASFDEFCKWNDDISKKMNEAKKRGNIR